MSGAGLAFAIIGGAFFVAFAVLWLVSVVTREILARFLF